MNDQKLNGFNNGRDTTDGVGGKPSPSKKLKSMPNQINPVSRRNRLDLMNRAEKAIYTAMQEVELMSANVRLTNAVVKLNEARSLVADFIDGIDTRHSEPDISAMVKASIIVNWEDWLTKKGYSDDFVELDKILTEYLTIPIHSDPPEFNPDLNTALNEGWNRCDKMWRDRINQFIAELKDEITMPDQIMYKTIMDEIICLESLLSDTEPKSPDADGWDLPTGLYQVGVDKADPDANDFSCRVWMQKGITGEYIIVAQERHKSKSNEPPK